MRPREGESGIQNSCELALHSYSRISRPCIHLIAMKQTCIILSTTMNACKLAREWSISRRSVVAKPMIIKSGTTVIHLLTVRDVKRVLYLEGKLRRIPVSRRSLRLNIRLHDCVTSVTVTITIGYRH